MQANETVGGQTLQELAANIPAETLLRLNEVERLRWQKFDLLSAGFVCLVDVMGDDSAIVQAARVSYGAGTKRVSEDDALIRYLLRHRHTTPFEMAEIKLLVKCPMDLWRQWIRHRTANVNEASTRYSIAIDEADVTQPDAWRLQSGSNKQGSDGYLTAWPENVPRSGEFPQQVVIDGRLEDRPVGHYLSERERSFHLEARRLYEERVELGVAREQARKDLPLSTYTMAYWKIDLHNLLHFLGLRMDSHAQLEIRQFANAIGHGIVKPLFPAVWDAFEKYRMNATFVSGPALQVMAAMREQYGADDCYCVNGVFTSEAFEPTVEAVFPDWMKRNDDGSLKRHREREEVRATLVRLGVLGEA